MNQNDKKVKVVTTDSKQVIEAIKGSQEYKSDELEIYQTDKKQLTGRNAIVNSKKSVDIACFIHSGEPNTDTQSKHKSPAVYGEEVNKNSAWFTKDATPSIFTHHHNVEHSFIVRIDPIPNGRKSAGNKPYFWFFALQKWFLSKGVHSPQIPLTILPFLFRNLDGVRVTEVLYENTPMPRGLMPMHRRLMVLPPELETNVRELQTNNVKNDDKEIKNHFITNLNTLLNDALALARLNNHPVIAAQESFDDIKCSNETNLGRFGVPRQNAAIGILAPNNANNANNDNTADNNTTDEEEGPKNTKSRCVAF